MKIVTSGAPYIDIDAYACMVALSELLNTQGTMAKACSTSIVNESVTRKVRSWGRISCKEMVSPEDRFIIVDASNPKCLDRIVQFENIERVIDHRSGFAKDWASTGVKLQIEEVGAMATCIYEEWHKSGLVPKLSKTSARLLFTAIIENTLDLQARITTDRDRRAYEDLRGLARLPKGWPMEYFADVTEAIMSDLKQSIINDSKDYYSKNIDNELQFIQLSVWDIDTALSIVHESLLSESQQSEVWLMNLIGVKQNRSYLISSDSRVTEWIKSITDIHNVDNNVCIAERIYLRKEIIENDQNIYSKSVVQ